MAATAAAQLNKLCEMRVNLDAAQKLIDCCRVSSEQVDLLTHARTRRQPPLLPLLFDFAPAGIGKFIEQSICRFSSSDRPVEVDAHVTKHVAATRPHRRAGLLCCPGRRTLHGCCPYQGIRPHWWSIGQLAARRAE